MSGLCLKIAEAGDEAHFVALGRVMHATSIYEFLPFDEDIAWRTATDYIGKDGCCALLVMSGDEAVGMHLASLTSYFFSPAILAASLVTFVRPDKRGGRAALLLMRAYLDWAKTHHADEAYIGVSIGVENDKSHRFFTHLGFTHVGGNYKMRLS